MTKQDLLTLLKMVETKQENFRAIESALDFISDVYELAHGCSAIEKDYSSDEVLNRLREFSIDAYSYDERGKYKE